MEVRQHPALRLLGPGQGRGLAAPGALRQGSCGAAHVDAARGEGADGGRDGVPQVVKLV